LEGVFKSYVDQNVSCDSYVWNGIPQLWQREGVSTVPVAAYALLTGALPFWERVECHVSSTCTGWVVYSITAVL